MSGHYAPAQPIEKIIDSIVRKNSGIAHFWGSARGWAPLEAAQLLAKSRLDRQVALSRTLVLWVEPQANAGDSDADGRLILGWANLGSLIEGTLKWFLSIYYEDYQSDINVLRDRTGNLKDPDALSLEPIRVFFNKSVWVESDHWNDWIYEVQKRRNAVHSYKDKDIGSFDQLEDAIRKYLTFVQDMDSRVPYPDEYG